MVSIRSLSKELQAIAESELNEKSDQIPKDLATLKEWIAKTPHLKSRTDDQFLVNILRGCKYSFERAKEKLDNYYAIRGAFPECFDNRLINDKFLDFLRLGVLVPLPHTNGPDGARMILYRSTWDPKKLELSELFKYITILYQILAMEDDNLVVSGARVLVDFKEGTMAQAANCTPMFMKKFMTSLEQGQAFRTKGVYYLNVPTWAIKIVAAIKMLVSEKKKSRIKVFDGMDQLYQEVPQKLMPAEYGGEAGTIPEIMEVWVNKAKEYEKYFEEDANYGTDEKLRPGKPKNAESLFGAEGSFRQMEFF